MTPVQFLAAQDRLIEYMRSAPPDAQADFAAWQGEFVAWRCMAKRAEDELHKALKIIEKKKK